MKSKSTQSKSADVIALNFNDNNLARNLFGPHESHLRSIEDKTGVNIHVRGGEVSIKGQKEKIALVEKVLTQLYSLVSKGYPVIGHDVERALRILTDNSQVSLIDLFEDSIFIPSKRKVVYPRSSAQKDYVHAMQTYDLTFGIGPAGTGKTYLAVAMAVTSILKGQTKRIVLTRPAIEAGEKLGFLPGTLVDKVDPYLRPLYDALHDMIEFERIQKMIDRGEIEVAPLAFMRGRTLNDAFIILDEAQNCTIDQMKMFLTRVGQGSKTVVTGDVTQSDLPPGKESGLLHAAKILKDVPGIHMSFLTEGDIVRHPLVERIIKAYHPVG